MLRAALDAETKSFFGFIDLVIILVGIILTAAGNLDFQKLTQALGSVGVVLYTSIRMAYEQEKSKRRTKPKAKPKGKNAKRK